MTLSIFFIIIVFLAAIQTAIPFLVKRTVIFGVTIPEQYIKNAKLKSFRKVYSLIVLLISIIALGIYAIWALTSSPTEELIVLAGMMIQFGIMIISMSLYFYFHGKTVQLKKTQKFVENLQQVQITDLTIRSQDEMLPWYVYLLPIIITVGLIGYTFLQYDLLPTQIPTHWGPNGEPDAFTAKTGFSVISMPLTFLVIQLMFLGMNIATKKSGIKLSATATTASRMRQLSLRKYSSWFMFFISILLTMLLSYFHLTTIHPELNSNTTMIATPLIFLMIVFICTIIFAVKVGRADKQTATPIDEKMTNLDDDAYWKAGLFYFNKNDPSIMVEKRFGVGWTLNFANPMGYLIVIVPLLIILLISFLQ